MAKKYVSTSRADRTEDKRKRQSNKAEEKRNSRKRDAAMVAAGGAGAVAARAAAKGAAKAAKSAVGKPPKPGALYRANQLRNLQAMKPYRGGASAEDIIRANRKAAVELARMGKIQSAKATKGAKGSGGMMGLRKDDISVAISKAKKYQGVSKSRYARLTGGGGGPGLGRGQGGRGGGGFLARGK
jgi:hypothetical protein